MVISNATLEREKLLKVAEQYRDQGYDVILHPGPDDVPDFLRNYRPNMIVRRGEDSAVVEVKSRASLSTAASQYLQKLAQSIEQQVGWRLELVVTNLEDEVYPSQAGDPLNDAEIKAGLQQSKLLATQHPEATLLYVWSLAEAMLRLLAVNEDMSLSSFEPLYLIKQLTTEGVISRSQYQQLMNFLAFRNAIAHGFKTKPITQDAVYDLITLVQDLLASRS